MRRCDFLAPEQVVVPLFARSPRRPDAPLNVAARTLVRTGLGAPPVVDEDGRAIDTESEREVIRRLRHVQAFTGRLPHCGAIVRKSIGT